MLHYLCRRLGHALATIVVAVTLIFLAMRVLPGNPLLSKFGQHADAAQMQRLMHEQGWDRPLPQQLAAVFWGLL